MRRVACAALLSLFTLLGGCSRSHDVIVASKNFTEQIILGEIAAQQIERKLRIPVARRLGLGGTLLAHEALVNGQIDLYPEYTGTASFAVLKQTASPNSATAYRQVRDAYEQRFHLRWLPSLGFNDTFAMVVRSEDAHRLPAGTLSAAATAREWRLGVGYEFLTRADGLTRLDQTYRLRWASAPSTMDLGLLYQALASHHVDMAAANSTDGMLTGKVYAVLQDDKKAFPSYDACLVVREQALHDHPGLEAALAALSGRISDTTMRRLNRQVDTEHRPVVEVVRDFLASQP